MSRNRDRKLVLLLWLFIAAVVLRPMVVCAQNCRVLSNIENALLDDPPSTHGQGTSIFKSHHLLKKIDKQSPRNKLVISPVQWVPFIVSSDIRSGSVLRDCSTSKPTVNILRI